MSGSTSLILKNFSLLYPFGPISEPLAPLPKAQIWLPFHCSCSWMIMRYGKAKRLAWPYPITIAGCLWAIYRKTGIARISWMSFQNMHVSWAWITPTTWTNWQTKPYRSQRVWLYPTCETCIVRLKYMAINLSEYKQRW